MSSKLTTLFRSITELEPEDFSGDEAVVRKDKDDEDVFSSGVIFHVNKKDQSRSRENVFNDQSAFNILMPQFLN